MKPAIISGFAAALCVAGAATAGQEQPPNSAADLSNHNSMPLPAKGTRQTGDGSHASPPASAILDEVVVTARKRKETLISAPVTVSVIGAEQIKNTGAVTIDAISQMVPQLIVGSRTGLSGGDIVLRGISGSDVNPFGDQAVSFYVDGVAVASSEVRLLAMTDLSQVEVLKGPQALLYGKNSPAGVILIRSQDPTQTFGAGISGGYGFGTRTSRTEAYVSGPIADSLDGRLAGYFSHENGYLEDETSPTSPYASPNRHNPDSRDFAIRGTLKWDPISSLDAQLKLNDGETDNNGANSTAEFISCPLGYRQTGSGLQCGLGDLNANASSGAFLGTIPATLNQFGNGQPFEHDRQVLNSLRIQYDLSSEMRLTATSGEYHDDRNQCSNFENDTTIILASCNTVDYKEFSQELRATSSYSGPLNLLAGAYFDSTRISTSALTYLFSGSPTPLVPASAKPTSPLLANDYFLAQRGTAYSGYAQLVYEPVQVLEIDAGARWSHERKELASVEGPGSPRTTLAPVTLPVTERAWNNVSPEVDVAYRPTKTLTLYASYKEGFLSGGFNSGSVSFAGSPNLSYNPETVEGYEGGIKTLLFNRTLTINASAYAYRILGLQVSNVLNTINTIRNAATAKSNGFEVDIAYNTRIQGLQLTGSSAYNNAYFNSFSGAPCYTGQTVGEGCALINASPVQNLSGRALPRAPRWSLNGGFNYERSLTNLWDFGLTTSVTYTTSQFTDASLNPQGIMPAYALVDSSIRLEDEHWQFSVIGRDLTNKFYYIASYNVPETGAKTGTPVGQLADWAATVSGGREVLLQASYRFGP